MARARSFVFHCMVEGNKSLLPDQDITYLCKEAFSELCFFTNFRLYLFLNSLAEYFDRAVHSLICMVQKQVSLIHMQIHERLTTLA